MVKVEELEQQIAALKSQVDAIQGSCEHSQTRVVEGPNHYGWAGSTTCIACGKCLAAWNYNHLLGNETAKDYIITLAAT